MEKYTAEELVHFLCYLMGMGSSQGQEGLKYSSEQYGYLFGMNTFPGMTNVL